MTTHTPPAGRTARRSLILLPMFLIGFLILTFSGPAFNGADILGVIMIAIPALHVARKVEAR